MNLDHDDLRAIEAAMATPGWKILRQAFAERTAGAIAEVFSVGTPPERREMLVAEERGRREVLSWFEHQLEDSRETRRVA